MKWLKNRASLIISEHNLQSVIHYADVGDRVIVQLPQGYSNPVCSTLKTESRCPQKLINGKITEVFPTGLKVRLWDGEIGTIVFFRWYNIIEIRKLKVKPKVDSAAWLLRLFYFFIVLLSIGMLILNKIL